MGMLVSPSRFGGANSGFLNGLSVAPTCCLSLRKQVSTATVAVRVRRSSDNAEQDIGFSGTTAGSGLDTAALATFVGSNSAFVTTFYDQTGNGYNAVQATTTKQPRIVNAGTYDSALVFDGTDDFLQIASLSNTATAAAIYAKIKVSAGSTKVVFETSTNYNNNAGSLIFYTDTSGYAAGMCQSSGATRANIYSSSLSAALTQVSLLWDRVLTGSSEVQMAVAGTGQTGTAVTTTECTGNFATYDMYIGGRAGTSLFTAPSLETLAFYAANTSGVNSAIEALVA